MDGLISLRKSMLVLDILYHFLRQHVSSKFRNRENKFLSFSFSKKIPFQTLSFWELSHKHTLKQRISGTQRFISVDMFRWPRLLQKFDVSLIDTIQFS